MVACTGYQCQKMADRRVRSYFDGPYLVTVWYCERGHQTKSQIEYPKLPLDTEV